MEFIVLKQSDIQGLTNLGNPTCISVNQLIKMVVRVAGKKVNVKHVDWPAGVESRNLSNEKIYTTG